MTDEILEKTTMLCVSIGLELRQHIPKIQCLLFTLHSCTDFAIKSLSPYYIQLTVKFYQINQTNVFNQWSIHNPGNLLNAAVCLLVRI